MTVLLNEDIFKAILEAIHQAKATVTFEHFVFRKSDIGAQLVVALAKRCRAGVMVKILLDAYGAGNIPHEYVNEWRNVGCEVIANFRPFRPWNIGHLNHRSHRRILVVDGKVAFSGGYAIAKAWTKDAVSRGRWRDTNLRIEGSAVRYFQAAFSEHWQSATTVLLGGKGFYPPLSGFPARESTQVQVVTSSPMKEDFSLHTLFLQTIASSRCTIFITTPYFFPNAQLLTALKKAAQRGVSVKIIVPEMLPDNWLNHIFYHVQRGEFGDLLRSGIKIYEYQPSLLHAKTTVVDGIWSTIGSANFDNRSMAINDELNVVFYGKEMGQRMEDIFKEDLKASKQVTLAQWQQRSWLSRLLPFLLLPLRNQL